MIAIIAAVFAVAVLCLTAADIAKNRKEFAKVDWLINSAFAMGAACSLWTAVF